MVYVHIVNQCQFLYIYNVHVCLYCNMCMIYICRYFIESNNIQLGAGGGACSVL